ncbi:MAG TPA: type II toxin-antitoxin system VapC family toxin [Candidatus Sulfotelmatobacter sp.]|jgi:predicted nucleic acid-binding protein
MSLPPGKRPRRYVLDANALVSFFENRAGSAIKVRGLLEHSMRSEEPLLMSAVTWGEVFYIEWRYRGEAKAYEAEVRLYQLPIVVISADQKRATRAGALKQKHNLSYADSFAAELAIEQNAWLVTADPEFSNLGKALSVYSLPRHGS